MASLTVSEIWIYPIKSLGGIRLPSAKVLEKGLEHDRRWMLIDENNTFMTQRIFPSMALFKLLIAKNQFIITHQTNSIDLPIDYAVDQNPIQTKVWDDDVITFEVSEAHSTWFSNQLKMKCKLVSFPEKNLRPVEANYKINDEQVSLADAYPFLIIGETSLADLNKKLAVPLPMNRFRPNIVFSGGQPYEEDDWKTFTVGKNKFIGVKHCSLCVMITINQDTAEKSAEPLRTLSTYRKKENKVYFGQNLLALAHFEINVGDKITLL